MRDLQSKSIKLDNMTRQHYFPNLDFYPIQSRPAIMDLFQDRIVEDLKKLQKKIEAGSGRKKCNITRKENLALKEIKNNQYLIIRCACKRRGGGGGDSSCNECRIIHEAKHGTFKQKKVLTTFCHETQRLSTYVSSNPC